MHAHIYIYMKIRKCVYMDIHICLHVYIYMFIHIHIYIYTYEYTYINTYSDINKLHNRARERDPKPESSRGLGP